jgi:hypothetical protein
MTRLSGSVPTLIGRPARRVAIRMGVTVCP